MKRPTSIERQLEKQARQAIPKRGFYGIRVGLDFIPTDTKGRVKGKVKAIQINRASFVGFVMDKDAFKTYKAMTIELEKGSQQAKRKWKPGDSLP